jgi:enediyne biosynthesis protein E4
MRFAGASLLALGAMACSEPIGLGGSTVATEQGSVAVVLSSPQRAPDAALRATSPVRDHGSGAWSDQPARADGHLGLEGAGVVVADFDGNGLPDVLLPGPDDASTRYLQQTPAGWTDATDQLPSVFLGAIGGSAADFDGDLDLDVLVTSFDRCSLLINDGSGVFSDGTAAAGLFAEGLAAVTSSWGDVDGDDDLDLVLGTWWEDAKYGPVGAPGTSLHLNRGDGTFEDASYLLPVDVLAGRVFSTELVDLDGDLLPELFSIHDAGGTSSGLFWNVGATWRRDAVFATTVPGMGVAIGDVNGDGVVDVLETSYGALSLLRSVSGRWVEAAFASGLVPDVDGAGQEIGWGAALQDLDNDADLDAFVVFGAWEELPGAEAQPDALFLADDAGIYTDVGVEWGLGDPSAGRGAVLADLDRDGWLDIIRRNVDAPATVHVQNPGEEAWVGVRLHQPGPNPDAIGARITVEVGETQQVRWISAGSGMFSGGPPDAFVGLADAERIDRIEVLWPDLSVTSVYDAPSRKFVEIRRL